MAEVNANALAIINPVASRAAAASASNQAQQAVPADQQPSFAQVLKSRSAPQQVDAKPTKAATDTPADKEDKSTTADATASLSQSASSALAAMLGSLLVPASQPTAAADEQTQSIDPAAIPETPAASTNAAPALALNTAMAATYASTPANLADQASTTANLSAIAPQTDKSTTTNLLVDSRNPASVEQDKITANPGTEPSAQADKPVATNLSVDSRITASVEQTQATSVTEMLGLGGLKNLSAPLQVATRTGNPDKTESTEQKQISPQQETAPAVSLQTDPRDTANTEQTKAFSLANAEIQGIAKDLAASEKPSEPGVNLSNELAQATNPAVAQQGLGTDQAARPAAPSTQHTVATPLGDPRWTEDVGQKLVWVANRDNGKAELILTPQQLGRIEVSINVNGDQASANFVAASPAAREALQDALPRLREMFAQAGINLGQANVNAGNSGQTQADPQAPRRLAGRLTNTRESISDLNTSGSPGNWARQGNGMIDTFA